MSILSNSTQRKKRLKLLETSLNKCRLDLSLKKLKTAREVLHFLGHLSSRFPDLDLDSPLTISAYNKFIAEPLENELREELRKEADNERNHHTRSDSGSSPPASSNHELQIIPPTKKDEPEHKTTNASSIVSIDPPDDARIEEVEFISKQSCTLYKFQERAAKTAFKKLILENQRANLLQAGVGVGKTFIYGKFLRELWSRNWFEGKTFSPWPALIVTKASIVTQTERVLENHFQLTPIRQFKVLNYDALRSGKGLDTFIELKKTVVNGEPCKVYRWKQFIHPIVFIIDECQSAKNEDSIQSQLIQNISEIQDPNVKILFSSATPFTRVSEAKYLCVNLGMEYKL